MSRPEHPRVVAIARLLAEAGAAGQVLELPDGARTAAEAAAGHPHAVFPTTPEELVRLTGGTAARVGNGPEPAHPIAHPQAGLP